MILVSPVQPLNAYEPIDITLSGMVILVRPVKPLNADESIFLQGAVIVTSLRFFGT